MISIIISVYNVEKYLEECLYSIFNQTYNNIEIILVNDGSTDNSLNIINKYREKYSNIVYIEQENKGLSEARNLGLRVAKGDYILYIDSDDYIDLNMLQLMIDKIKKDNSDMVIIGHTEFYDDINGKDVNIYLDIDEKKIYTGIEVAHMMLECKIMGVAWNKLYKKEKLIDDNFIFESGRYTQDWYPTFRHISTLNKISFVNKPLYKYRLRSTSTTSKKNEKRLEDYSYAVSNIINYVENSDTEFNKKSIILFKAITFNRIISLYYSINSSNQGNIYTEFKKLKYNNNNIGLRDLVDLKELDKRTVVYILAWKFKLYRYLIKIEKKIVEYKNKKKNIGA